MMGVLLFVLSCAPRAVSPTVDSKVDGRLIIAHTNDLHAHFQANRADWLDNTPDIGGFGEITGHVEALHVENGADTVLYLDGGDIMTVCNQQSLCRLFVLDLALQSRHL